ncbi:integrase [Gossypium australe]|uniref:Integrase n=1 Tax=Gossypium australe TaxID=47621 RepID=A0A5B6UXR3_9ROSI|nr:integrase [Gossypium australe]
MEMRAHNDGFFIRVTVVSEQKKCDLVRTNWSLPKLAEVYISKIVRLHGVPILIIFDQDP